MIERDPQTGMIPISMTAARSAGLIRYFTGRPCKRGHIAERFVGNRQCVACGRDHNHRYYADNMEAQRVRCRENARANKEEIRAHRKTKPDVWRRASTNWAKKYPDRKRAVENRRRARKYAAGGSYRATDIAEISAHQRGRCAYCRAPLTRENRHIDHIEPIAKGGTNDRSNLQLLCQPCNSTKGSRDPIVFAQSIGRLL